MMPFVDVSAIQAAAAATSTTYRSFADATRSVLDLLERHMPGSAVFLAHLDRGQFIHRIVDVRRGSDYGLRSNQSLPLGDAFCSHMAEGRGPRLVGDIAGTDVYSASRCSSASARAPTWASRWSFPTGPASGPWPPCPGAATLSPLPMSSFHHARSRSGLGARTRIQRTRPP